MISVPSDDKRDLDAIIVLLLWVYFHLTEISILTTFIFDNITNSVKQRYLILRWENLYVSGSSPDFPTNYGEVAQGGRASVVRQIQVGTHTIFFFLKKIAKLYRTEKSSYGNESAG